MTQLLTSQIWIKILIDRVHETHAQYVVESAPEIEGILNSLCFQFVIQKFLNLTLSVELESPTAQISP